MEKTGLEEKDWNDRVLAVEMQETAGAVNPRKKNNIHVPTLWK